MLYRIFWFSCLGRVHHAEQHLRRRAHLSVDDVQIDKHVNPKVIFLRIKCSKTDPFRQGRTIRLGVSGTEICAVRALLHYLHRRGGDAGPLFRHCNGQPLTRPTLTAWLKNAAARAGLEGNFSGHSFRIGAATSAAAAGT